MIRCTRTGWAKSKEQGLCWVVADACGRCHRDLWWGPPWGHEALYWVGETHGARAVLGVGGRMRAVPLGPSAVPLMGPRNSVMRGRNAGGKGYAGRWRTHAGGATGTFGGPPHGATTRCTAWAKRKEQGLFWVVADACGLRHWDLRWVPL
eukprot:1985395-Pyramimonas_sp.AAC.2